MPTSKLVDFLITNFLQVHKLQTTQHYFKKVLRQIELWVLAIVLPDQFAITEHAHSDNCPNEMKPGRKTHFVQLYGALPYMEQTASITTAEIDWTVLGVKSTQVEYECQWCKCTLNLLLA